MKLLFSTLFMSFFFISTSAQVSDSLQLGKNTREFFIKGDQKFKFSEYKKVFTNPEALGYMKKSNTNGTVAQIFGAIGGGFVGFGLAKEIFKTKIIHQNGMTYKQKDKGGWGLVGIGLGAIGIGIPFAISASKNLKKAVNTQNQSIGTDETKKTSYKLDLSGNSVGVTYSF